MAAKKKNAAKKKGRGAKVELPDSGRIGMFERAHKWRLVLAKIAKERGLSAQDLTSRRRPAGLLKDLAAETTKRVGFTVDYHGLWKFLRSDLLEPYLAGNPPAPHEQLEAAIKKQGQGGGRPRGRRRRSATLTEESAKQIAEVAGLLEEASRRLRSFANDIQALSDDRDELARVLEEGRRLVERRS